MTKDSNLLNFLSISLLYILFDSILWLLKKNKKKSKTFLSKTVTFRLFTGSFNFNSVFSTSTMSSELLLCNFFFLSLLVSNSNAVGIAR